MSKPRDRSGNDFIFACGMVAVELYHAKYGRQSDSKIEDDDKKVRALASDLYTVIMKHWDRWNDTHSRP
jgi:hypothetical protein